MKNHWDKLWSNILIPLAITLCIFLALDMATGHSETRSGEVVDKIYRPARDYTTFETTHNGKYTSTRIVHHHDPPSWKFVLKLSTGETVDAACRPETFYQTSVGSIVPFKSYYGGYTGIPWSRHAL